MNVELGHQIFGHRAISSLIGASKAGVWDDVEMTFGGDSWCDHCKITIALRNAMLKTLMNFNGKPLEHIFIDCIPSPEVLRGVPENRESEFLFICDPMSRYVEKISVPDKS
jgi:hypothetical protein